ncbi:MAG: hypothetical protein BMS9Abin32_133 [Gammaproteobacteria bacterium]|nr:MAG: hypothetical protein BMS9Abin32_133 [Gammaproteobacteria bacterium]
MTRRSQTGFTLYELMITLLIIGVVLTIGVPNLSEFRANSNMTSTANDLLSSFQLARSEAARTKAPITICASANSTDAAANCGGTFDQGWIIFTDLNGDIDRAGAGETVLRAHPAVPQGITISPNAAANYFAYAASGLGRGDIGGVPAVQTVMICDSRGNAPAPGNRSTARRLVVTPIGRATVISDKGFIDASGDVCP